MTKKKQIVKEDKYFTENIVIWIVAIAVGFVATYFSPRDFSEGVFTIIGLQLTLLTYVMLRFWR